MPTKESFDIDGLMVFRSDLTAVDQDGNTVASVITPDKYVQSGKEPVSDEQMGRFTNTTAYWNAHSTYVPRKGEVIIYSDGGSITEGGTTVEIPKIKIGDGTTTVVNLPFTDSDTQGGIAGTLDTTNTSSQTPVASESLTGNVNLHKVSKTGDYGDLLNKPQIPTVNNATLTIQKNGTTIDTFTANAATDKTINITVPTTASDVSALPSSTKYAASLSLSIDSSTYVVTAQLKDQDGNNLGSAQTIDLPLESVVVSGSYNAQTKKVVLTLQNGSTIEFSVADLVAGLQSEITAQNPLSADLIVDGTTNKVFTLTMKNKLDGIEAGAEVNVQSDWNQSDNTKDDYIKNKPNLATVATSGDYDDLTNKPTIPAAQIQSDWAQTDNTKKDYIKNKPQNIVTDANYVHTDNNYTTTEKNKLAGIESGAEVNVQADWSETDTTSDAYILHKPDLNATLYEAVTYSQLVAKINNSQLVKGKKYRITDYVTTTTQSNTSSAGHAFDLVVTAIDVNKLDCKASALLHSGDTYFSTAGADLSKWQIWYDVNNDTTKYAWADATNGKGVIYRMIDEWRNDCPYDFKNILFTKTDAYESAYTFTKTVSSSSPKTDHSLTGECFSNIINDYYKSLGFIVFLCNSQHTVNVYKNYFDIGCHDILSKETCCYNKLGEDCENILFDSSSYNALAKYCYGVTFGAGCSNNVIEIESFDVVFGSNCFGNVLRGFSETVRLGNSCSNNIIGRSALTITFGNSCSANKIGDNSLGISFGNGCDGNVVGYQSYYITLRDYCLRITISSGCASILFGNSSEPSEGGLFCKDITIDEGCQHIRLYNTSSPSASNYLQNIYIAQGVSGTSSSYFEISTIARNLSYRTTVGRDSSGNIRIYNEDDPASASQAQANWNETSSSSPSYIQNKPTLTTVTFRHW